MTFGNLSRVDGRFGINMGSFFISINSASLTYEGFDINSKNKIIEHSEIRFNTYLSVYDYRNALDNLYEKATKELDVSLFVTSNKFDKLFLVSQLISEVESFRLLLVNNSLDIFSHNLYQFSNISIEDKYKNVIVDESYCQEYYQWMDFYLKKILSFLLHLKESVGYMNQVEFLVPPPPPPMLNNINISTQERPFGNFEYLFVGNGISKLRQNFIPSDELYFHYDVVYDPETETITEYCEDEETGEMRESTKTFNNYLISRLNDEYYYSRHNIDSCIDAINDDNSAVFFIKRTLSNLKYLLTVIDLNEDAKKYEDSNKPIKNLIWHILIKYEFFVPTEIAEEMTKICAILNGDQTTSQKTLPPAQVTKPTTSNDNSLSENSSGNNNDKDSKTKVVITSFGYKTSDTKKLENIIRELNLKIDLLDSSKTNCADLLNLLCADNYLTENYAIYLGCETTQFYYIVKKLKPYFKNLTAANLEVCNCFYSKNGTLINAQNLYSSNLEYPKEKETIDNIIKDLQ